MNATPTSDVDSGMTDSNLPARRYSDKEISRLLKRATELQSQDPNSSERDGMTLAELEGIAREAGIDPAMLQRAASELDREPARSGLGPLLAGDTLALVIERSFEGELDASELEALVPLINSAADTPGNVALVGRTLNFNGGGQQNARSVQVLVTSREGRTQVRIEERYGQLAGGLFAGLVGGGGMGLGVGVGSGVGAAIGSALFVVGIPVLTVSALYGVARTIYRNLVGKRRKVLTGLVDRIGEAVEASNRQALRDAAAELPPGSLG